MIVDWLMRILNLANDANMKMEETEGQEGLKAVSALEEVTKLLKEIQDALREQALKVEADMKNAEAQTASQVEMDKLKKRVSQIETDLEEKDKEMLEQEKQLLSLTDQVEAHQKLEESLKRQISELEDAQL